LSHVPYSFWHIHWQEGCLEEARWIDMSLAGIVIILLVCVDSIVLMARSRYDLDKQLKILNDLCSSVVLIVNTNKTKIRIIISKKIMYANFVNDNNTLEEVTSYKYPGINLRHELNWNYGTEKRINGWWKAYYGLENICKSTNLWLWVKKKLIFETLITLVILYGCEVWGCSIFRESWRKIEQIQKCFITYNLKIKGNTSYHMLLTEASLSPIERTTIIMYLMYKRNINNMDDKMLPKINSNSNQNHQRLNRGWHKDVKSWLNIWGIQEDGIMQNTNNIKNILRSKFENLWCDQELEDKMKSRYYKVVCWILSSFRRYSFCIWPRQNPKEYYDIIFFKTTLLFLCKSRPNCALTSKV